jgi:hypothetical protein
MMPSYADWRGYTEIVTGVYCHARMRRPYTVTEYPRKASGHAMDKKIAPHKALKRSTSESILSKSILLRVRYVLRIS